VPVVGGRDGVQGPLDDPEEADAALSVRPFEKSNVLAREGMGRIAVSGCRNASKGGGDRNGDV
jgi:hypothetical protein